MGESQNKNKAGEGLSGEENGWMTGVVGGAPSRLRQALLIAQFLACCGLRCARPRPAWHSKGLPGPWSCILRGSGCVVSQRHTRGSKTAGRPGRFRSHGLGVGPGDWHAYQVPYHPVLLLLLLRDRSHAPPCLILQHRIPTPRAPGPVLACLLACCLRVWSLSSFLPSPPHPSPCVCLLSVGSGHIALLTHDGRGMR